jgi:Subtilase family
MAAWKEVLDGLEFGGYVAWETAVEAAQGNLGRDHVPVLFELAPKPGTTLLQAIDATLAIPGLRISRHERDLLETERKHAKADGTLKVRSVVFWPRAGLGSLPDNWTVLQVGPPLSLPEDTGTVSGTDLCALGGDLDPEVPVVAVIDDGIGFLNARFRKAQRKTRFLGVWLQAAERGGSSGDVLCGTVLSTAEIDAHLGSGQDEALVYRMINRKLFTAMDRVATDQRVAHGTHVLDLAAGADPWAGQGMSKVPVLAVQLPPSSIRDTSGRRSETHLIQGLRWILAEVLRQANHRNAPRVVVNISLGTLAGPGDKSAFLADWFIHEVARFKRLTGKDLRLVLAYGNARLWRLAARDELRTRHPLKLDWRIQPDDRSASFIELRLDRALCGGVSVCLTPPTGSALPALKVAWPKVLPFSWQLPGPKGPVAAAIFADEGTGQMLLTLALAPTLAEGGLSVASAGLWQITLTTGENEPIRVVARVQRDDTPAGHRPFGRQSWLDDPEGWGWDNELRAHVAPARPPVSRQGTAVSHAAASGPGIWLVGAARPDQGRPGGHPTDWSATPYSSEGAVLLLRYGESAGPDLVAPGDLGVFLQGVPASGVLSGTRARLSGTSMAAPAVARRLIEYLLNTAPAQQNATAEWQALTGQTALPTGAPHSRQGHGTLV